MNNVETSRSAVRIEVRGPNDNDGVYGSCVCTLPETWEKMEEDALSRAIIDYVENRPRRFCYDGTVLPDIIHVTASFLGAEDSFLEPSMPPEMVDNITNVLKSTLSETKC